MEETETEHLKVRAGMYIDCNDKMQRRAVLDAVRIAVGKMKETNKETTEIKLELLVCIEAVMERQEEIIEDQEERIAIMEEGMDSG